MFGPSVVKGSELSGYGLPNRSPAKRVRFGKEEQRHERALTFIKKVGASDIKLAPTWSEWRDLNYPPGEKQDKMAYN